MARIIRILKPILDVAFEANEPWGRSGFGVFIIWGAFLGAFALLFFVEVYFFVNLRRRFPSKNPGAKLKIINFRPKFL
jgi:hypothetical protein